MGDPGLRAAGGRARKPMAATAALALLALPTLAAADRGAVTVEAGGALRYGGVAPDGAEGPSTVGSLAGAWGSVRYALSNRLELQVSGFWMVPAAFVHDPVQLRAGGGSVTGALTHDVGRWGGAVGARFVAGGLVWRVPLGVEAGWAHTTMKNRDLLDTSDPTRAASLGLDLRDTSTDQLLLAPFAGIEWLAGDHLSFSVVPRLEVLLGGGSTIGLIVPLTMGWSFYLL